MLVLRTFLKLVCRSVQNLVEISTAVHACLKEIHRCKQFVL